MKKIKLFGKNIAVNCDYCNHSKIHEDTQFCTINKAMKNGKCRKFVYNPTMRIPKLENNIQKFTEEDFKL